MRGRIILGTIGVLVAASIVLTIMTWLGSPVEFTLAWLLIVGVVVLAFQQPFVDDGGMWPPEQRTVLQRGSDVSRLAWSVNPRTGIVGHVLVARVQQVLRRRLARHGLDLDDQADFERIDALVGRDVREVFGRREVRRRDIELVLDAVDRIPTSSAGTASQER
ncbi:hypothetical protein ACFVAE_00645 [Microbacterium sp. NPDC057659]|uniref:hypothetical protein n=1 Tax=Microbacterium sp. NPDC057659 TaxID=3346198 RepID=UPI003673198A